MTDPLPDVDLMAMIARDEATGDGFVGPDYHCADDRHVLLGEVNRLRQVVARLREGIPVATSEGAPWQSE